MHRLRPLILSVAITIPLVAVAASPPGAAGWPQVEEGLLPQSDGTYAAPVPDPERLSLIVRLAGPTLWQVYQADRRQAALLGTAPMSTDTLATLLEAMERRQQPTIAAIEALGATVIDSYQAWANGLLVYATRDQIARLVRLPGVVSVARAPVLQPLLDRTVPHLRADQVWDRLGFDGSGVNVAIIDTGVDYTHEALGGPGTPEAYAQNDPEIVEPGSFPTSKVVGGYDFVGPRFSPSCPPGSTGCSPVPEPDDDPLDISGTSLGAGHGTHVSGIVASMGTANGEVARGVAPGAQLVALKVFGDPLGGAQTTNMSGAAIEWVVRHNMGLAVSGTAPEGKIQVINLSLGSAWSFGMLEANRMVRAAVDAGATVVSATGNYGNIPHILGSPASAEMALAVGGTHPPGETQLYVQATWEEGGQTRQLTPLALEGQADWLPQLETVGDREAPLAWYGLACDDDQGDPTPPAQEVAGKIALIERGQCTFYEKIWNARQLGAVAAVVFTDHRPKVIMACGPPSDCNRGPEIPAVMIDRQPGLELRDLVWAGGSQGIQVTVRLSAQQQLDVADMLMSTTSRGPSRFSGGIKPQLVAPGSAIKSAAVATGNKAISFGGTSMSGPHVAGVAALLWQRNLEQGLGLDAAEIGALAMNYALPVARLAHPISGRLAAVARQGAGLPDALASARANTVVRSESGIAELSFENPHLLDRPLAITRTLTVGNLSEGVKTYAPQVEFLRPEEDEGQGVSLTFQPQSLTVAAGGHEQLQVVMQLDPPAIRPWPLGGVDTLFGDELFGLQEVDGFVRLVEVDGEGRPVANGDLARVPFHVLPRRNSCVTSTTAEPFVVARAGDLARQVWHNPCGTDGRVEVYRLVGTDPAESREYPEFAPPIDIEAIGIRWGPMDPADPQSPPVIEWAIHTAGSRRVPINAEFHIYVDPDLDGDYDQAVLNLAERDQNDEYSGRWLVARAPVAGLQIIGAQIVPVGFMRFDIEESTTVLAVPAADLGIDLASGRASFDFAVVAIEVPGDYEEQGQYLGYDLAPDNLEAQAGGGRYRFDQSTAACLTLRAGDEPVGVYGGAIAVPAGAEAVMDIAVAEGCQGPRPPLAADLLFSYPDSIPGGPQAGIRRGLFGRFAAYLPYTALGHELRVPPLEVPVAEVLDSGISGTATFTAQEEGLEVTIQLEGVQPGSTHPAFIRRGSCEAPGEVAYPLEEVVDGVSQSFLEGATLAEVADGEHVVTIELTGETVVACGAIPSLGPPPVTQAAGGREGPPARR